MLRKVRAFGACLWLLGAACGGGAGSPDAASSAPDPLAMSGSWTLDVRVEAATGGCVPEIGNMSTDTVTFTVTANAGGYDIVLAGLLGIASNVVSGSTTTWPTFQLSGSYPEDGGTTTATHHLKAETDKRIVGTENWAWAGGSPCPSGLSLITLTRP